MSGNKCQKCGDIITDFEKHATFQGMSWHRDCFHCFKCSCALNDIMFGHSEDQDLLCHDCYDSKYVYLCIHCKDPIKLGEEKFVLGELFWHRSCFKCKKCESLLNPNSFWIHEDLHYCKICYGDLFTENCEKCHKKIIGDGIKYRNKDYHFKCFLCSSCELNLVDKRFFFRDNFVYCQKCLVNKYAKKCLCCDNFIKGFDGDKMMSSGDQHWHDKCFFCQKCQQSLVGQSFMFDDCMLLCSSCGE